MHALLSHMHDAIRFFLKKWYREGSGGARVFACSIAQKFVLCFRGLCCRRCLFVGAPGRGMPSSLDPASPVNKPSVPYVDMKLPLGLASGYAITCSASNLNWRVCCFPGLALHEKGLQRQIGVGTLLSSQERRALFVPLINRG